MPAERTELPQAESRRRFTLIGWPLAFSLSPAMYNAAFTAMGIGAQYELAPTPEPELEHAVGHLRCGEAAGANVTMPHKRAVLAHVDGASPEVAALGAANTLVYTDGRIEAHNTDVSGFAHALDELLPEAVGGAPGGTVGAGRAVVLGAGGGALAASLALVGRGWSVSILARDPHSAAEAAERIARVDPAGEISGHRLTEAAIADLCHSAELLVNATPVGAAGGADRSLWPQDRPFPERLAVLDMVAWPPETELVDSARRAGARAAGGLPMLVWQAAAAIVLFTGRQAPVAVMRRAAESAARERCL